MRSDHRGELEEHAERGRQREADQPGQKEWPSTMAETSRKNKKKKKKKNKKNRYFGTGDVWEGIKRHSKGEPVEKKTFWD